MDGARTTRFAVSLLVAAAGVFLCSLANALARAGEEPAMTLYILGLLIIGLPIFFRLLGRGASAGERLALVCLLGVALYLVKVVHDAPSFTFTDELIHAFNVERIGETAHLFHHNPVLKVTPYYPGLEGATSALAKICGLSTYTAGLVLVGVARLTLIAALFLLFERVGGSARTAGLAAAIYTTNFNFLFWGAQFAYESLALPLLVIVLLMLVERETTARQAIREWAAPLTVAIAAIVVTHHLTSYALAAILVALAGLLWYFARDWKPPNPWPYALLTVFLVACWLAVVAGETFSYLSNPLSEALEALANTISGESAPRGLFQSSGAAGPTPLGARLVALLGVALLGAGWVLGIRANWRRWRERPWPLLFMVASLGFFLALGLRLAPAAWETGNRASEFFFIGLAFVVAGAGLTELRRPSPRIAAPALTAAFGIVLVGGVISGWPWDAQLAKPLHVSAEGKTISSPPLALAEWARAEGPEGKWAAATADANLLLVPGNRDVVTGSNPDVEDLLTSPTLEAWELPMLRQNGLEYVVADQREISSDGLQGYFFPLLGAGAYDNLLPASAVTKFGAIPGAARIYDNGTIAVYDLRGKP
ncbi:MAG: hypothetical protein JSU06_14065 [Actinobacteria bacterium]|nr:hypothetical protein [Actinomycetota bacterium]